MDAGVEDGARAHGYYLGGAKQRMLEAVWMDRAEAGDGWSGMDPKEEDWGGGGGEENERDRGDLLLAVGDPEGDAADGGRDGTSILKFRVCPDLD